MPRHQHGHAHGHPAPGHTTITVSAGAPSVGVVHVHHTQHPVTYPLAPPNGFYSNPYAPRMMFTPTPTSGPSPVPTHVSVLNPYAPR